MSWGGTLHQSLNRDTLAALVQGLVGGHPVKVVRLYGALLTAGPCRAVDRGLGCEDEGGVC